MRKARVLSTYLKALQALHDAPILCLFLLLHMFRHKKYQCNYQISSNPLIISKDIEHKHNSKSIKALLKSSGK